VPKRHFICDGAGARLSKVSVTSLPVVDRELAAAARHRNTYRTRVAVSLAGLVVLGGLALVAEQIQSAEQGRLLFGILSVLAFLYCLFAGVAVTADGLSEEKREGTLGLLFLTDLKGYDVVLGKLAASSLKSFYGLLACVPVLALSMLLGGVTAGEMVRAVAVLLNTLFFSLALGVFVSTLSRNERKAMFAAAALILLLAAGPWCLFAGGRGMSTPLTGVEKFLLWPSPIFAVWLALSPTAAPGLAGPPEFWRSLASTHALGWLLLICSSLVLPRVWSDRPRSGRRLRWWEKWQRWSFGGQAIRRTIRARLLDQNPILWLAGRDRFKLKQVWIFLGVLGFLWIPAWLVSFDTAITAAVFLLFCAQGVLKLWVVSEVCSRWVEDRRSGALELLLSSPLNVSEIARGQWLALRAQFGKAAALLLALDLLLWIVVKTRYIDSSTPRLLTIIPAGMVMFVVDLVALRWVALWLALTSKNLSQAMGGAWVRILGLPWLIHLGLYLSWSLIFQFAGRPGPDLTVLAWTICWVTIGLVFDAIFGWRAKRGFLMEFRALASERLGSRKSAWTPLELIRSAVDAITSRFSISGGEHAPPRVPTGALAGRSSHDDGPEAGVLATPERLAGAPTTARQARALPGAARRHAFGWVLVGAMLLIIGWFGWYRWSLGRQIQVQLAAIQKAGYPVTEAELIKWHRPIPGEENAASVVEGAAIALYSTQWLPKPAQDLVRSIPTTGPSLRAERLSAETRQALASFVSSNQTALSRVHEVTRYPKSRYDSVWNRTQNPGWAWWVPDLRGAHELLHLQRPTSRPLRLHLGVSDALPKLVVYRIIEPIFRFPQPVQVSCWETKLTDMLIELAAYRLDVVLADEPVSTGVTTRVFNHFLGECGVTFCAAPPLAEKLRRGFPGSLNGAPALLPMSSSGLRRSLEKWFQATGVRPRLACEIEDPALVNVLALHGLGFMPVPTLVVQEVIDRFGFRAIGRTEECQQQFNAITPERKLAYPAVTAITSDARLRLFPGR
jgi:ABC-type Na+ efflux pump permease subunit